MKALYFCHERAPARDPSAAGGRRGQARGLAVVAAMVLAMSVAGGASAFAQSPMQGLESLPGIRPTIRPDTDPYPFDAYQSIKTYIQARLPQGWWSPDPFLQDGVFSVKVNIPDSWSGNPTGAMLQLCPPPDHHLWRRLKSLNLYPFYRHAPWPSVTCRP